MDRRPHCLQRQQSTADAHPPEILNMRHPAGPGIGRRLASSSSVSAVPTG